MEFREISYKGTPASREYLLEERDQAFRDTVDAVDIMVIFPSSTPHRSLSLSFCLSPLISHPTPHPTPHTTHTHAPPPVIEESTFHKLIYKPNARNIFPLSMGIPTILFPYVRYAS